LKRIFIILLSFAFALGISAQMKKIQNRPYIDQRRLHYGFLIGLHTQDLKFVNNGFITENGESWFADVASYSPGFSVGVLGELYLTRSLALRAIPTLHFGDKIVIFKEQTSKEETRQQIKSTYLSLPLDLKFSAERFNNYRPYIMAGINPTADLSIKKNSTLLIKSADCYLEAGVGCDFYLPYFKLIPELKFCFGLSNLLQSNRTDLNDKSLLKYTQSVDKISSRMIVLSFYFE
jgi:hypothetical protein